MVRKMVTDFLPVVPLGGYYTLTVLLQMIAGWSLEVLSMNTAAVPIPA